MKILRNIFISTTFLVTAALIVILSYFNMVMEFNPDAFRLLIEFAVGIGVIGIAASMLMHRITLGFAFKLIKLPEAKRFASVEDWKKADKKLAAYPRVQGLGTLLTWVISNALVGVIFYMWMSYIAFREMIYIVTGGLIMGSVCGGYNYFFFKLHLAPLRRSLSSIIPPENWEPEGSMRKMLYAAFVSICMALTLFPSAVFYTRMDELHWDAIRNEGLILIRRTNAQLSGKELVRNGILSPEASHVLDKTVPEENGAVILFDNAGKVLYGIRPDVSENAWAQMNIEKSGKISDSEANMEAVFGPVGKGDLKAAMVYPRKNLSASNVKSLKFIGITVGMALFMALGLIILIRLYLGGAVKRLVSRVEAVAAGDLKKRIPVCSDGEMGTLEMGLGFMKQKLVESIESQGELVKRIGVSVEELVKATDELRVVAEDQSTAAAEQAGAAQEAGVTSQELKASSVQIADRASSVNQIADETLNTTTKGGQTAAETVKEIRKVEQRVKIIADKMLELGENLQNIGKLADTIEDISQNTQLLAINAAIESDSAGVEGERFGVVAAEIRNIANFTAQSAEQVRSQVEQIRKTAAESAIFTEEGTKSAAEGLHSVEMVANAFSIMEDIARKTTQNAMEITLSTKQQATATSQMAFTMNELNDTAVKVAESAKKVEAATMELDSMAEELKNIMSGHLGVAEKS